jgi:hypothetical protein
MTGHSQNKQPARQQDDIEDEKERWKAAIFMTAKSKTQLRGLFATIVFVAVA